MNKRASAWSSSASIVDPQPRLAALVAVLDRVLDSADEALIHSHELFARPRPELVTGLGFARRSSATRRKIGHGRPTPIGIRTRSG
jgi:hypothetical protein